MAVIKRTKSNSIEDLQTALARFIELLQTQGEKDAASSLTQAKDLLKKATPGSPILAESLATIKEAFEGDHELSAYTHHRKTDDWTEREELATASARVWSLTTRLLGHDH